MQASVLRAVLAASFLSVFVLQAAAAPCATPPPPPPGRLCEDGRMVCVDKVIREMDRRFQALAATCDHDAVFALVYLRTTEEFRRAVAEPGFFADTDYLIRQDVRFASYYFDAYDAWAAGDLDRVPEAWRIAFDAARKRAVSGTGDILLGMNAHINRDLPFVLAGLGLTFSDGSSRKPDHDKVNDFLWRIVRPALDEAARRFDPSIDDANLPGTTLDEQVFFQLVTSWREGAWQNAVRLVSAETEAERAQVAASIEAFAAETARLLRLQNAYVPPLTSTAARDAWCTEHGGEASYGDATSTDLVDTAELPGGVLGLSLSASFPNPFNPRTTFSVAVADAGNVGVAVYDLLGRRVALLHDGPLAAGTHRFTFDAADLPSGRYLVRVQDARTVHQRLVTLLK